MKSLQELSAQEHVMRLGDFGAYCRLLAVNKGDHMNAADMAPTARASARVVEALRTKAPVPAAGAGGEGAWGEQSAAQRLIMGAFSDALKWSSAFARMFADRAITRVPLETVLGLVASSAASAAIVAPGQSIPARRMDFRNEALPRRKAAGLVALTTELLRQAPDEAEQIIVRGLRNSVAEAIDRAVLNDVLLDGVVAMSSQGAIADVGNLLAAVAPTNESRLYFVASPDYARTMATANTGGVWHFPTATPTGGQVLGVPVLVTPALSAMLVLIDAVGVAGDLKQPDVSISTQATIELSDAPTGSGGVGSPIAPAGATEVVSLFQADAVGIKVVQSFGAARLRSNAIASVFAGGSPA